MSLYCEGGGFAWDPGEESSVLSTYYATSILFMLDALDQLTPEMREATIDSVMRFYDPELGGFFGGVLAETFSHVVC